MIDIRSASVSCKIAAIVGVFYLVVAIGFAAIPETLVSTIDWKSKAGLYAIAAIDLVIGLSLIWAAPSSRSPVALNIFGAMALLGAVFYFLAPVEFLAPYLDWWLIQQITLSRIMSVMFGLPLGAFILFAAIGSRPSLRENSASHAS